MKRPKCLEYLDTNFGKELIQYLGGNPDLIEENDCWEEFAEKFPELKEKAENYFEEENSSEAAYWMYYFCNSSKEWAEKIIEKNNNSRYVYYMCCNRNSSKSWAEKIIEKNNDSKFAYYMCCNCNSSKSWAEKIKFN